MAKAEFVMGPEASNHMYIFCTDKKKYISQVYITTCMYTCGDENRDNVWLEVK